MAKMMRLGRVLLLFAAIASSSVANAARFLSSMPNATDNVLTVNVGEQISFTCSHENILTGNTLWTFSPPVNCSPAVVHLVSQAGPCPPFSFEDISTSSPFTSTAVATASVSMTGAVVTCKDGATNAAMQVGLSITLCIVDDPPPSQNFQCQPLSNGIVQCSWGEVDQDCAMDDVSYNVTIIDSDGNVTNSTVTMFTNATFTLIPGQVYNATLVTIMGDRESVPIDDMFMAQEEVTTISTVTTTPPVTTSPEATSQGPPSTNEQASTGTPFWVWIIIVVVIVAIVILVVIPLIVFRRKIREACCEGGKHHTDGIALKPSSGSDTIKHEPAPSGEEYAVVDTTGRSKPTEDLGSFYQDPKAIEHEEAPTGDVYTVVEKKPKKKAKEPTEDELAQMYSVPDKSKKNQGGLNYAALDMAGGSGGAPPQQQLEYATVVN